MTDTGSSGKAAVKKGSGCGCWAVLSIILLFVILQVLTPIGSIRQARRNGWMQQGRQIGQMMFAWSVDHGEDGAITSDSSRKIDAYPNGKSSTEVFQMLLDQGYANDPVIFYIPMPGKVKPVVGQKLKPENVCWDITVPVDSNSNDGVPLVFLTGYKIDYVAGGKATPIVKPYPQYGLHNRTWVGWWNGEPEPTSAEAPGIAVFYKGNNGISLLTQPDGTIPIMPQDFKPDGKVYRQLTPDGILP